jgi:hypothetical protein
MAKFDKNNCLDLLKSMLPANPVIYYVNQDEVVGKMTKHTYRFFVINESGHYNVSGLITAIFGANVNDRSCCFSLNALNHEDDIASFKSSLIKLLTLEKLELADLILSAKETLEFTISPNCFEFFPLSPMPRENLGGSGGEKQDPIELSS